MVDPYSDFEAARLRLLSIIIHQRNIPKPKLRAALVAVLETSRGMPGIVRTIAKELGEEL